MYEPGQDGLICLWKDLYYLNRKFGSENYTTFGSVDDNDISHPLYPCIGCDGYETLCKGYRSLESIGRKR